MDDMEMLGALLAKPGPSSEVVDRGRHQLQETMHGPVRKRRTRWLATGAGLAAAVVVAPGALVPTATRSRPPAAVQLSGRQILLAAATTAGRTPEGHGAYWYVKTRVADSKDNKSDEWETWTRRDGRTWFRGAKTQGRVVKIVKMIRPRPFFLAGAELSFEQLQKLPTDPAALKAWIVVNAIEHGGKHGDRAPDKSREREAVVGSLTALVSELPAPPEVRAAAFRVMASLPGVRSLGAVKGGQGLLISLIGNQQARLVVDPATSRVRDTNFVVTADGAEVWLQRGVTATVIAEWTKVLPKVVPLPPK
ncbi:MAG TPA: CU044_5270 family protein [Streptosporangiaceae bacterium]